MGYLDSAGLAHFWGKVKGYVDGRPGGGSAEEIYSTEETRIGTWFGKPLYRKGFEGTIKVPGVSSEYMTVLDDTFGQSCRLVRGYGTAHITWGGENLYQYSIPVAYPFINCHSNILILPNNNLVISTCWNAVGEGPFKVAVEYTKIADEAEAET